MINKINHKNNRILIIVSSLLPGGAERVSLSLAEHLLANGFEPHLFVARINAGDGKTYSIPEGVSAHYVQRWTEKSALRRVLNLFYLRKLIKGLKPAWIVSLGAQYGLLNLAGCFGKTKVLLSERNYPRLFYSERELVEISAYYGKATKVVFQTRSARECFPNLSDEKCLIIPNAAREDLPTWSGANSRSIAFVGRLASQKNPTLLIDSFGLFSKKHPGWTLDIYGDGPMRGELLVEAQRLGISKSVVFHGNVRDVCERVAHSAMYVSTSDYEGISNSLLEAAAMGVPIVATDCAGGGARAVVADGETGYLVPCGDAPAVSASMERIANDAIRTAEISKNALQASKLYSPDSIYGKWLEALSC